MNIEEKSKILDTVRALVEKEAQSASGIPGEDTNFSSVSSEHENFDKNQIGPEKLKQKHDQKSLKNVKENITEEQDMNNDEIKEAASTVEVGEKLLSVIGEFIKDAKAIKDPAKETNMSSVSDEHDTVNQNAVGSENLAQGVKQKKQTKQPVKAKSAAEILEEEIDKRASYAFGQFVGDLLLKSAINDEIELAKQAGRRDFEQLIAYAAAEIQGEQDALAVAREIEKQAEYAGAMAFAELAKEAEISQAFAELVQEAEILKLQAQLEKKARKELEKQASELSTVIGELLQQNHEATEIQKQAAFVNTIVDAVIERLRNEVVTKE